MNFYNEIDPYAAQWLRNLIAAGHIPAGIVDERSIEDITPDELRPYTQCHFFAGIAGWSHALALAGWPSDRPVWTGSCPCQPFSAAGKGAGFDDQRHLWPAWFHLIRECRPAVIFGEQVASKDAEPWVDLVHADLETVGYAFGCVPFPAAGIGAPHIRDRNYWCGVGLADTDYARLERRQGTAERSAQRPAWPRSVAGGMADQYGERRDGQPVRLWAEAPGRNSSDVSEAGRGGGTLFAGGQSAAAGDAFRLAYSTSSGRREERSHDGRGAFGDRSQGLAAGLVDGSGDHGPGPLHGFWRTADWLLCRDGKWRPVIATHVALVDGLSGTVGYLRAKRETEEKVSPHAPTDDSDAAEVLPSLRGSTDTKDDQREDGRSRGIPTQDLLQSAVHGACDGQGNLHQQESRADEGASPSEAGMPELRQDGKAARPSPGREPFQQFAVELDDIVSLLPSSLSLAAHDGRRLDAEALRALCESICSAGSVRYAPEQAQAVWASLGQEAKDRIGLGFDVRAWRKLVFQPLSTGEPGRVGRLRAYGNAIVPQEAAEFVASFLDIEQQRMKEAA